MNDMTREEIDRDRDRQRRDRERKETRSMEKIYIYICVCLFGEENLRRSDGLRAPVLYHKEACLFKYRVFSISSQRHHEVCRIVSFLKTKHQTSNQINGIRKYKKQK